MGLSYVFRFWVQVQCFRPCYRDQHALTQVHHPCCLTNSTNCVHLMANNSSSAFASCGKIHTALLNFGNSKRWCLFCIMRLCRFCLMRQNKIHDFIWADQDWIGQMIFKNFEWFSRGLWPWSDTFHFGSSGSTSIRDVRTQVFSSPTHECVWATILARGIGWYRHIINQKRDSHHEPIGPNPPIQI